MLIPGTSLDLTISDPFELSAGLLAQVVAVHAFTDGAENERLLVSLDNSLIWSGTSFDHLVLERRSFPGLLDELQLGQSVDINGYGTLSPDDAAPWGVESWRGGLAFVGTASVR